MPRPRTVLALMAVVMLSVVAARIRGASVGGQVRHATAAIVVDGVPQTISVGLPSEALDQVHGPVQLTVQVGAAHTIAAGTASKGAFQLDLQIAPAAAGTPDDLSVAADVHSDNPIEFGLAISAPNEAPTAVHGSSDHELVARLSLNDLPLAAEEP